MSADSDCKEPELMESSEQTPLSPTHSSILPQIFEQVKDSQITHENDQDVDVDVLADFPASSDADVDQPDEPSDEISSAACLQTPEKDSSSLESKRGGGGVIRRSMIAENSDRESPVSTSGTRRASVSDSLMRTTAARENERAAWETQLEEKKVAASPQPVRKQNLNYVPAERLLKPTQSRLNARKQWEEELRNRPFEDDIWWEKRKPAQCVSESKKNQTASRLNEPTLAALNGKREKFPMKKDDPSRPHSPSKDTHTSSSALHVAKIDANSPLLKSTCAQHHMQMDKEGNLLYPPEVRSPVPIVLEGKATGPAVASKLMYHTKSFENSKWSNNNEEERSPSQSPSKHAAAKPPSSRLLEFNASMNAQRREKLVKPEEDEREVGWNSFHTKERISANLKPVARLSTVSSATSPVQRVSGASSSDEHVFNRLADMLETQTTLVSTTPATATAAATECSSSAKLARTDVNDDLVDTPSAVDNLESNLDSTESVPNISSMETDSPSSKRSNKKKNKRNKKNSHEEPDDAETMSTHQ
jgi:hypothetical protein